MQPSSWLATAGPVSGRVRTVNWLRERRPVKPDDYADLYTYCRPPRDSGGPTVKCDYPPMDGVLSREFFFPAEGHGDVLSVEGPSRPFLFPRAISGFAFLKRLLLVSLTELSIFRLLPFPSFLNTLLNDQATPMGGSCGWSFPPAPGERVGSRGC